ncbi:imidazole glycerol phosphate synthase, glutamine amidotransferase subunit [Eggerthia catenaformis OT 569 = DSM 20559]|uniref:Imidazole glycerol phosphate synthase subunit HisH n=1 Tax=Eggerthia catenaformis OT 569 = DSM 20559 TaxID=999415 RepID=M2Q0E6_9FIRM|nr:imidazole glycerol phosphate synthase subunit HisH [Eggerthia catenaformis]EMD16400.1 imidazole glycerol phosphate synthase, glutamine amidotransferase subunit [Eggerthia catenaformis OT 569 = DSM 20559]
MICVIDYNLGNLSSVTNALKRLGMAVTITRDPAIIRRAKGIILPGVGTFPVAMKHLRNYGLVEILNEMKDKHIPILGICLGMQVLFEKGLEVTETEGLGFLKGTVEYMDIKEKIPHMGWNQLEIRQKHPILKYIKENDYVYFVHSFMAHPLPEQLISVCYYGNTVIPAVVANDCVIGCQFHPEKSGQIGEKILLGFKEMTEC